MVVGPAGHSEGVELDRRIDLVNVVFGAALGGYIGVVMTRRDLTLEHSIVLCIVLLMTVCLLVALNVLIWIVSPDWAVRIVFVMVSLLAAPVLHTLLFRRR